jgi:predicted phage baseplate assembly protein
MPLPEPYLDDLRFQQDLVDEARKRIVQYCPEWTDYNLSDPGITLIELFAWMTEMTVYRLNRVPEKNYIKFMELLGLQLQAASSAHTELTFWLSTPFPTTPEDDTVAIIPQGTEVATRRTEDEDEIVFTTDQRLEIVPPQLTELRAEEEYQKNYVPRLGVETFLAFGSNVQVGDTFYMGFDESQNISGQILQLTFECEPTQATGIRREDPPLVWECSVGDDEWQEVSLSTRSGERDTTGGLNNPEGSLVIYLPISMQPSQVYGRNAYWIRCRFEPRREEQGRYTESPRILNVLAHTLGGTTYATHAQIVEDEVLGRSNGDPGQIFYLENSPVLELQKGETVQIQGEAYGEAGVFIPWQPVKDFSGSDRYDHHFVLDMVTGQIQFGPAVRQPNGTIRQYGRIPEMGKQIRFTRYRYGGGTVGNVPVGKLQVLKSSLAYIDRVANLQRAAGGRDQESLEEAKSRAQRELRAQQRAVTPEDYEDLAKGASRAVARVKCNIPQNSNGEIPPGVIEILIVPAVADSLAAGDLSRLHPDEILTKTVEKYLDKYRLLTTTLRIKEPNYIGVKVEAQIVPSEFSRPEAVRARVNESLKNFITPLTTSIGNALPAELSDSEWEGWPFGRNLYTAEISSLIQRVPGVKHVLEVKVRQREVIPAEEVGTEEENEPKALSRPRRKVVRIPADTLLCSLEHEITIKELEEEDHEDDEE